MIRAVAYKMQERPRCAPPTIRVPISRYFVGEGGVRKGYDETVGHSFRLIGGYPKNGTSWRWSAALTSLTVLTIAACTIDTPPPAVPMQISRPIPEKPARPHHRPVPRSPTTEAPAKHRRNLLRRRRMLSPPSEPSAEEPAQAALAGRTPPS
jgi:hypothetical protein